MKIYISGKITGDRRYKAKFREVEKKLAAGGPYRPEPRHGAGGAAPRGLYAPVFRYDGGGGRGSVHAGLPGQPRRHAGMGVVPVRWETDLFRPGGVGGAKTE